jgi:UDP-glucuronate 4-epimerase
MSILVTGGAGFIGSHLIERLIERATPDILCLDNYNDFYSPRLKRENVAGFREHPSVKMIEASFRDTPAMKQLFVDHDVQQVIHLGAYAGVRASVDAPLIYQQTNVGGTLALLEAARHHPVRRFLLVSSSTVYGRGAVAPFVEDAPLGIPMSPYGASKRSAELLGLTYHDLHQIPLVIVRPFSVFGARLRPDLALAVFTRKILAGEPLPLLGDGSALRDFTHVSDICDGLLAALTAKDAVGQAINLGHHAPIEMRALIRMLEQALDRKAHVELLSARPEDMPLSCADLDKAARLLEYHPRVPIEVGLKSYVQWYLQQPRATSPAGVTTP